MKNELPSKAFAVVALACATICPVIAEAQSSASQPPVATIEDSIRMNRIQYHVATDDSVAAISPNGKKAATVVWHGDLDRNTNIYTLMIFDLGQPSPSSQSGVAVLSRDFDGDPQDQTASPFQKLTFFGDNRSVAFIGRQGDSSQVFTVDTETHQVHQLTHSPTPVRSFLVDSRGKLQAFSAENADEIGTSRLDDDGVFMWDPQMFQRRFNFFSVGPLVIDKGVRRIRQYFVEAGSKQKLFFDSRQSKLAKPLDLSDPEVAKAPTSSLEEEYVLEGVGSLTGDPKGRYALMFPYALTDHPMNAEQYAYYHGETQNAFSRRAAAPYGLLDLKTGKIERLIDSPHPAFERYEDGPPVWLPDGRSVVIYTLSADAPAAPPAWVEVDIATRKMTPLGLPKDTRPIFWSDDLQALVVTGKDGRSGLLHRRSDRSWEAFAEQGATRGFNNDWSTATNGHMFIGVKDSLTSPPELTAYRPGANQALTLSDLNPRLRQLQLGEVTALHWNDEEDKEASGFLVKPVGYQKGVRYPLVILLDDGTLGRSGEPFIFDGVWQLSGHAAQMLAGRGFMVLYTRERHLHGTFETPEEGIRMRQHIEGAVGYLDGEGLIDPKRIGISGWSRAGYHTDYLLIHSTVPFAAATTIDGGGSEYNDSMRPFTDEELRKIRTPLMFETHGLASIVHLGAMADRMMALGRPAEILYFAKASHSTTRPQHRFRSLQTHIDWWRFWLKNEEDPDSAKADEYAHWRQLRAMQQTSRTNAAAAKAP